MAAPKNERRGLDRAAVIRAAGDLADRDGFDALSVSAVARDLGVQPASLYSHVRDRAAVLDGVQEAALGELADLIAAETAGRADRDALAGMIGAYRSFAREHPGRWAALQRPAAPSTSGSEAGARLVSFTWAVLRGYRLPEAELVHATRFVGATINGFLALERAGSFSHRDPATETSWARAVDVLDRALGDWPTEAAPADAER
ncbi:TetR/AcrR family transcriptional regulator [Herbiconiux solani]|uniref:TetR/AcrR family transcriptional regulator n=1 Tax=Herbiconiux solani TaxID=661329 RepID=UPI000825CCB7|nr:TetR/AcrR family transcriptional regulator [Herbiconiux solani]